MSSPSLPSLSAAQLRRLLEVEVAEIHLQAQQFVDRFTAQVQSSLTDVPVVLSAPSLVSNSSTASPPLVISLDEVLPPAPKPKRKPLSVLTSSARALPPASPSTASLASSATPASEDEEEEVELDTFGRSIRRRRSKLPLKAVLLLRRWFAQHLSHPYPTDAEKEQLAKDAHLTSRQVQNCPLHTPRTPHSVIRGFCLRQGGCADAPSASVSVAAFRADQHAEALLGSLGEEPQRSHVESVVRFPLRPRGGEAGAEGQDGGQLRGLQPGGLLTGGGGGIRPGEEAVGAAAAEGGGEG